MRTLFEEERVDGDLRLVRHGSHLEADSRLVSERVATDVVCRSVALQTVLADDRAVLPGGQFLDRHQKNRLTRLTRPSTPESKMASDQVGDAGLEPTTSTV